MRNHGHSIGVEVVPVPQSATGGVAHDDRLPRQFDDPLQNPLLPQRRLVEHRMQRDDRWDFEVGMKEEVDRPVAPP